MSWLKLILKLLRAGCPFILPLDSRYEPITQAELDNLITEYQVKELYYHPEIFDCDDFAWVFKGLAAERRRQAVGFVIGWWQGGLHCWNVAITETGLKWIEPQTGKINQRGYWPWLVII